MEDMNAEEIEAAVQLAREHGEDEDEAADAVQATHEPYFVNSVDHVGFSALMVAGRYVFCVCSVCVLYILYVLYIHTCTFTRTKY